LKLLTKAIQFYDGFIYSAVEAEYSRYQFYGIKKRGINIAYVPRYTKWNAIQNIARFI
jgi:hypothetical protein